jgi:hypothetical protein
MGEVRNKYEIVVGKLKGRDHLEDPSRERKRILEWIRGK